MTNQADQGEARQSDTVTSQGRGSFGEMMTGGTSRRSTNVIYEHRFQETLSSGERSLSLFIATDDVMNGNQPYVTRYSFSTVVGGSRIQVSGDGAPTFLLGQDAFPQATQYIRTHGVNIAATSPAMTTQVHALGGSGLSGNARGGR